MSGHSKWATTKHKKALVDAKRGKVFTKMAKLITIAARDGGGDPAMNPSLRTAIDNAKAVSLPKDNIERAIRRGIGGGEGSNIEEVIYEAYGPGGTAIIIECLTDNKNRVVTEVKTVLNKLGGTFANAGSVTYLFSKKGEIIIESKSEIRNPNVETKEEDLLEEIIINSGAEDFESDEENTFIYTSVAELQSVSQFLKAAGVEISASEIVYLPKVQIEISEEKKSSVEKLLDALDDLDDVNKVYSNADL